MPSFQYAAVDRLGIQIKGTAEAPSRNDLEEILSARGFTLVSAQAKAPRNNKVRNVSIKRKDLVDLTHNLAILEASGVPLFEGLTDLAEQVENPQLKAIFSELVSDVGRGKPLSEAMGRYPSVFPPIYVHVVRAGEQSGALDQVLQRLAEHLEWRDSVRGLVKQMLIYPTILFTAVTGLVVFLLTFLIPRLIGIYASSGVKLPVPTRVLITTAGFLQAHWIWLATLAFLAITTLIVACNLPAGRLVVDSILLRIPWIGTVVRKVSAAQFAATLSTLYRAGVDLQQAMDITASVVENAAMARAVRQAKDKIIGGTPLSEAVKSTNQFQPLVTRMIAIGERAGRLEEALGKVVAFYDREVPAAVKRFMAIIEPGITIFAGLVVGFIVLCAILPIFKLFEALKH